MTTSNRSKARSWQFIVSIDSEREITPRDLMEAFESSKTIRLEDDFVVVQEIVEGGPDRTPNPGVSSITHLKGKNNQ